MPNINDPERIQLIESMAKHESIAAAEAVLEKGIELQDKKRIETATSMLQDILTPATAKTKHDRAIKSAQDAYADYVRGKYDGVTFPLTKKDYDAFYSSKRGESMRPVECRPEDCKTCFWLNWCELKESFDFMKKVNDTLELGRKLVAESKAKLVHKDTKQTWGAQSETARSKQSEGETEVHPLPRLSPPSFVDDEMIRKKKDWRVIRKEAKDILEKAKRNN